MSGPLFCSQCAASVPSDSRITEGTSAQLTNQSEPEATTRAAVQPLVVRSANFNVAVDPDRSIQLRSTPRADVESCGCAAIPVDGDGTGCTAGGHGAATEDTEWGATEDTEDTESDATEDTEDTESDATEATEDTESDATEDTEDTESDRTVMAAGNSAAITPINHTLLDRMPSIICVNPRRPRITLRLCREHLPGCANLVFVDRMAHTWIDPLVNLRAELPEHVGRFVNPLERDVRIDVAAAKEYRRAVE